MAAYFKNLNGAKKYTKDDDFGRRNWSSDDGLLNEAQLRSHARQYKKLGADMNEFISFCQSQEVPEEVLARVLSTVR